MVPNANSYIIHIWHNILCLQTPTSFIFGTIYCAYELLHHSYLAQYIVPTNSYIIHIWHNILCLRTPTSFIFGTIYCAYELLHHSYLAQYIVPNMNDVEVRVTRSHTGRFQVYLLCSKSGILLCNLVMMYR